MFDKYQESLKVLSEDNKHNYGIILDRVKNERNIGTIMRTCANFRPSFIATIGSRYRKSCGDTIGVKKYFPIFSFKDAESCLASVNGWPLISIELSERARNLATFNHPQRAIYVFGPEDGSISEYIQKRSKHSVFLPTYHCLNLSVCVGATLWDRTAKQYREN